MKSSFCFGYILIQLNRAALLENITVLVSIKTNDFLPFSLKTVNLSERNIFFICLLVAYINLVAHFIFKIIFEALRIFFTL